MKFYREYQKTQQCFQHDAFIQSCIPYKFWKKYIKHHKDNYDTTDIVKLLEKQCLQTDTVFTKELSYLFHKPNSFLFRTCIPKYKIQTFDKDEFRKELILFSELNNKTIYKICKKLQKNGVPNMLSYYSLLKSSHRFHFLGGPEIVYIKLQDMKEVECPICLDTEDHYPIVIFHCSHSLCYNCFRNYSKIDSIRGTLYNRIINSCKTLKCPVCRTQNPLHEIKPFNFYPTLPKNYLQ